MPLLPIAKNQQKWMSCTARKGSKKGQHWPEGSRRVRWRVVSCPARTLPLRALFQGPLAVRLSLSVHCELVISLQISCAVGSSNSSGFGDDRAIPQGGCSQRAWSHDESNEPEIFTFDEDKRGFRPQPGFAPPVVTTRRSPRCDRDSVSSGVCARTRAVLAEIYSPHCMESVSWLLGSAQRSGRGDVHSVSFGGGRRRNRNFDQRYQRGSFRAARGNDRSPGSNRGSNPKDLSNLF